LLPGEDGIATMAAHKKYNDSGSGEFPVNGKIVYGGFDTGTGRYDLGVPGLVAECIENMYRSTGADPVPRDRLLPAAVITGVLMGFGFGFHPAGIIYGPIGAALGVIFGAAAGGLAGVALRKLGEPWLMPQARMLRQVRRGDFRSALRAVRRAGFWVFRDRNPLERLARLLVFPLGLGSPDLPPDIAAANLAAVEGVLAESVGDVEEATRAYLRALHLWPRHTFVLASLMELTIREETYDRLQEVVGAARRYLDRARDQRLVRAVDDHLEFLKKSFEHKQGRSELKAGEEEIPYMKEKAAKEQPSFNIVENPGSQITNGLLIIERSGDRKALKLAAMPFHLLLLLAESGKKAGAGLVDPSQAGWVSIQELLEKLPWTTPNVTNSNVHKLVYKLRNQLESAGLERALIEENLNGCYRLGIPPQRIEIRKLASEVEDKAPKTVRKYGLRK